MALDPDLQPCAKEAWPWETLKLPCSIDIQQEIWDAMGVMATASDQQYQYAGVLMNMHVLMVSPTCEAKPSLQQKGRWGQGGGVTARGFRQAATLAQHRRPSTSLASTEC